MLPSNRSALVYGDVDLGLIDGSAVWVTSIVEGLVRAGCTVTLQLKAARRPDSPLLWSMRGLRGVRLVDPPAARLKATGRSAIIPRDAAAALHDLDAREHFDLVVVRGLRVANLLARDPAFSGRLWTYLTDIPQSVVDLDPTTASDLRAIAEASRVLLCQTEDLRSYLESIVPAAVGRTALLPPMVPAADGPAVARSSATDRFDSSIRGSSRRVGRLSRWPPCPPVWPSAASTPSSTSSATRSTATHTTRRTATG